MRCNTAVHMNRRALMKGLVATASGGILMNWGGIANIPAIAAEANRQQKHCILLWMNGGASQFETFDMKPGRPTGGQFRPISTNVNGTQVCELMPKMAQQMDKVAVIRSMRTSEVDHPGGVYLMHTGWKRSSTVRYPEFGANIAKYNGNADAALPSFIKLHSAGSGAGFLGAKYQPFRVGPTGDLPRYAFSSMKPSLESRRNALRNFVEDQFSKDHKSEVVASHRESYEAARRLQAGRKEFNIDDEWPKYEKLYGNSSFGRRCLLARKLVEAGVAFVEVGQYDYDSHADNFRWHEGLVPPMDHAFAGLLEDLSQRGLLDKTLIVWMGEIGRTPYINNRAGRDHYVRSWSTVLAGCGIKKGIQYGKSDKDGDDVLENQVTEGDFFATIYQALGIDPHSDNYDGSRPIPLAPFGSKVVKDLFA